MDQTLLNKLMEIKHLYEKGILTKEEMEAEKAKILHPEEQKDTTEENASQMQGSSSSSTSENDYKWLWIGGIVIILLLVMALVASKSKERDDFTDSYEDIEEMEIYSDDKDDEVYVEDEYEQDTYDNVYTEDNSEPQTSVLVHYRLNRPVVVHRGPGENYETAIYNGQGRTDVATYDYKAIVESKGLIVDGYIFVSDCGCQGGHGANEDGWIPLNAVEKMNACDFCNGEGYSNEVCPECEGEGLYICSCHGEGKKVCPICNGVGAI